jgi:hypothetical protein
LIIATGKGRGELPFPDTAGDPGGNSGHGAADPRLSATDKPSMVSYVLFLYKHMTTYQMKNHDLSPAQYSEILTGMECGAEPLTQIQAAEIAGLSARRLQQLVHEQEAPPRAHGGGYPVVEFRNWLLMRWRNGIFVDEGGSGRVYQAERARLMFFLAEESKQREADLRSKLVPASEAAEVLEGLKAEARAAFLPLSAEIGTACQMRPAVEVEAKAREIVYRALNELAKGVAGDE